VAFVASALEPLREGWANHQRMLATALRDLTPQQLALRTAPHMWAVWQLAAHVAGARMHWFHDVLGEGYTGVRDNFRVASTTVPDLPLEDAGWEDDENHPRRAEELVEGLTRSWDVVDQCLARWTAEDIGDEFSRRRRTGTQTVTRGWVIWHVMEHDVHHGGEISQILGSHHVAALTL
jgi:uncharacterized damage-inducible protein DinB